MDFGETLIAMTAVLLGGGTAMLLVLAISVRFAFKPALEAWAATRRASLAPDAHKLLERRIELLEEQVRGLERDNARLLEDADFRLRLRD
jgi:hypothetical protein